MQCICFQNDWQQIPVIKIDRKKGGDVFKDLKTNASGLVSFQSLLGPQGEYLLAEAAELANVKKPAERSESDKEILKVDERFNILYNVLSRGYLKIFPNKMTPTIHGLHQIIILMTSLQRMQHL